MGINFITKEEIFFELRDIVKEFYGYDVVKIKSQTRDYVSVRNRVYFILRNLGFTYEEIGGFLNKNHATIIYGVNKQAYYLQTYKNEMIDYLKFLIYYYEHSDYLTDYNKARLRSVVSTSQVVAEIDALKKHRVIFDDKDVDLFYEIKKITKDDFKRKLRILIDKYEKSTFLKYEFDNLIKKYGRD